ncbi:MAG: histidinol-phosphatase [Anaerolineaceae bacterium]|nr:histidinol-phosphatase [Anaerolineaceae bacterium]
MTRADLHTHTTASDGQQPPETLVQMAAQLQLQVIAITDHDTTAGVAPAQAAASGLLSVIPSIELGARHGDDKVDILGYFIDTAHHGLQTRLARFRENRLQRGRHILERLNNLDILINWQQVMAYANGDAVGRPHIARAMVEAGYVRTIKEAFDQYLGGGKPAYVPRDTLTLEESIHLIHAAGGAAVLAHPVYVPDFPQLVERLVPAGLDGIEVSYPAHTPAIEMQARQLADKYDLVMTGGSDFHGIGIEGKAMLGSALAPAGAVESLRTRAAASRV